MHNHKILILFFLLLVSVGLQAQDNDRRLTVGGQFLVRLPYNFEVSMNLHERWVNASGRSDTQYNSVNSYAMLHVRYRLNIFGGKADTEGRYDKKWGGRDQQWRR